MLNTGLGLEMCTCVVLSGATVPFMELIEALNIELIILLKENGFKNIYIQYGHAKSVFNLPPLISNVKIHSFDFMPEIKDLVKNARLVITHAGSGSILDALERGEGVADRRVIVVVNEKLMDNHQTELANKLKDMGCVQVAKPSNICEVVENALRHQFTRLQEGRSIQYIIDNL